LLPVLLLILPFKLILDKKLKMDFEEFSTDHGECIFEDFLSSVEFVAAPPIENTDFVEVSILTRGLMYLL